MKRFASLDFLRGIAILMMLIGHQIADFLDLNGLFPQINSIPLFNIFVLVILPFIGGLAGFFLLISSIANSISCIKNLEKGHSTSSLALKQLVGGFLIYIFAMLSESTIGYYGGLMGVTRRLNVPLYIDWAAVLSRWGMFETIHTIAWCIMINGVITAFLSRGERWKNPLKQMKIYGVLAVLIVAITPVVWIGISKIIPGFPFGTWPSGTSHHMPQIGKDPFGEVILGAILGAMAAPMEPIFPYLAVSLIGTMIGIGVAQPEKGLFKSFFKSWFSIGTVMYLIGIIGVGITLGNVIGANFEGFDRAVLIYRYFPYHRHWAPDAFSELSWISYLWQFLAVNGWSIVAVISLIYAVDFRNKGE